MTERPWTDREIATLRRLWAEGASGAEIGRQLGRSRFGVIGKAHRLKLAKRPVPPSFLKQSPPKPKPLAIRADRLALPRAGAVLLAIRRLLEAAP